MIFTAAILALIVLFIFWRRVFWRPIRPVVQPLPPFGEKLPTVGPSADTPFNEVNHDC